MDTELAMNWFSEQFCGRLLEGLQDEDQSLPNIPIADLGDLDISIPPPQMVAYIGPTTIIIMRY